MASLRFIQDYDACNVKNVRCVGVRIRLLDLIRESRQRASSRCDRRIRRDVRSYALG
jgi:hypothetical protein